MFRKEEEDEEDKKDEGRNHIQQRNINKGRIISPKRPKVSHGLKEQNQVLSNKLMQSGKRPKPARNLKGNWCNLGN